MSSGKTIAGNFVFLKSYLSTGTIINAYQLFTKHETKGSLNRRFCPTIVNIIKTNINSQNEF